MLMEPTVYTFSLDEIENLTSVVVDRLKSAPHPFAAVIALEGDLGAGKTTFVQALGRRLGVSEPITSPTFTILKSYETTDEVFQTLLHMDAYRIDDESELGPLRFGEVLATQNAVFCIEWPERIAGPLMKPFLILALSVIDENTRSVRITETNVHSAT